MLKTAFGGQLCSVFSISPEFFRLWQEKPGFSLFEKHLLSREKWPGRGSSGKGYSFCQSPLSALARLGILLQRCHAENCWQNILL